MQTWRFWKQQHRLLSESTENKKTSHLSSANWNAVLKRYQAGFLRFHQIGTYLTPYSISPAGSFVISNSWSGGRLVSSKLISGRFLYLLTKHVGSGERSWREERGLHAHDGRMAFFVFSAHDDAFQLDVSGKTKRKISTISNVEDWFSTF